MTHAYKVIVLATLLAALSACGSGSGGTPPPSTATPAPSAPQATATLVGPAINAFPWAIETATTISLRDPSGNLVPVIMCQSADVNVVTVASNCSNLTLRRLGSQNITVSGGGHTASLALQGVPQRHWSGLHGVASAGGSGQYNLVVMPDGSSLAWGANGYGVLGQNSDVTALSHLGLPVPVLNELGVPRLSQLYQISAGDTTAFALSEDGGVWGWGRNSICNLARSPCGNAVLLPARARNAANNGSLSNVVQVEAGDNNAVALIDNGTVMSWAYYHGQGDLNPKNFPGLVRAPDGTAALSNIVAVSAGGNFSLGLSANGRVYAWGYDLGRGTLGAGVTSTNVSPLPNTVKRQDGSELNNIVSISAGYNFALALAADGSVWAWGANSQGQLGQNTLPLSVVPYAVQVLGTALAGGQLTNIAMVAAGGNHALALDTTGRVFSWGLATSGQLGEGANRSAGNQSALPVATVDVDGSSQLTGVVSIAAGNLTSSALKSDGRLLMWGDNFRGALGRGEATGTLVNSAVAAPVVANVALAPLSIGPLSSYPNLKRRSR